MYIEGYSLQHCLQEKKKNTRKKPVGVWLSKSSYFIIFEYYAAITKDETALWIVIHIDK